MANAENLDLTIIFRDGARHTITVDSVDFHDFYVAFYSEKVPLVVLSDIRTSSTFAFKNKDAVAYIADISEIQIESYQEFEPEADPDDYA